MTLVDIEKLEYEPFIADDSETVDYISAEALHKAPRVYPVNHAEWVLKTRKLYSEPDQMFVEHTCSHCGHVGHRKILHVMLWEAGYKDTYNPELYKFCPECGYKMDLRKLYEQYKHQWCAARGYILDDVDEETGINGECYACFTEWYNNEYLAARGE